MPDHNIAVFLVLSVAAHVALLLAYEPATPEIGHSGHIVQLSVTERAGHRSAAAATEAPAAGPPPATPPEPATAPAAERTAGTGRAQASPEPAQAPATFDEPEPVATAAAVAASPLPSPRESEDHLRRSVLDLFSQRLDYPAIARRKGWQGTVTLRLLIEPDGRISRLQVDRTSGYAALDQAAVESLQLASVPQAKHWLHGRALELLVPVEYRLVGG